ncbi:hypothetical protein OSB04_000031 [Centaurea solstitialis]|uniref:Homeobox domain-containing protein n=1 Tax=Centaurea solstitialis TaxID=347529 RepID=A0AA38WRV9_9ASTR|nr:hypothetical protein OSB04_000031 [Centaurea solstitialis]
MEVVNSRVLEDRTRDCVSNSMSQDYIFNFSHGFERSSAQDQQNHLGHQIRRDKLRFEPPPPQSQSLVGLEQVDEGPGGGGGGGSGLPAPVYETGAGMLSEMFNFPLGAGSNHPAPELLVNQMNYQQQQQQHRSNHRPSPTASDWYGNPTAQQAMQLFLTNPSHESPSSQSPSHHHHHHHNHHNNPSPSSTLHMLLPNTVPSSNSTLHHQHSFGSSTGTGQGHFGPSTQFTWVPPGGGTEPESVGGVVDNQRLSLSLSSTLQHLEAAKVEELRIGDDPSAAAGIGSVPESGDGSNPSPDSYRVRIFVIGVVKVLRNSRYVKAAQELLEEFCSVGRGQFKKNKSGLKHNNPNPIRTRQLAAAVAAAAVAVVHLLLLQKIFLLYHLVRELSTKEEKSNYLLCLMRYNHYCEQMQMVVNSFDLVMGFGAAVPYTALAQKAMSRHFRCLKDAIAAQLKHSCELLGEKDAGSSGVTKGETPRLKLLEQSLRQQRAFHQMGMMEQEAWRPQRGLPERSVNILRAWLFEHFLHPYPSDADKHLLARQTGLSRNQVSNWFINARVRLWKPMVEEMYQQESKDETHHQDDNIDQDQDQDEEDDEENNKSENINYNNQHKIIMINGPPPPPSSSSPSSSAMAQTPMHPPPPPSSSATATTTISTPAAKRSEKIVINDQNPNENDPSRFAINSQQLNCFSENQAMSYSSYTTTTAGNTAAAPPVDFDADVTCRRGTILGDVADDGSENMGSTLIRFGTSAGDVSLTLGLRHAGNLPEKTSFSVRDFGGC